MCFVWKQLLGVSHMINTCLKVCFLWAGVELDRGQASHSAGSCIVLQMVPVRPAKRQPEETFFTVFIFSVLFLFSLSITPGHSLCLSLSAFFPFYFCPYSISPPSPSSPPPSLHFHPFPLCLSCWRTVAVSKAPHKGPHCTPSPWHLKE